MLFIKYKCYLYFINTFIKYKCYLYFINTFIKYKCYLYFINTFNIFMNNFLMICIYHQFPLY